jgi:hypothetical protein
MLRRVSKGGNVHPSHGRVIAVLSLPSSVLIKLTRRAYLSATEPPDAKSFVREYFVYKFFETKDFGPLSRVCVSFHKTRGEGVSADRRSPSASQGRAFPPFENRKVWGSRIYGDGRQGRGGPSPAALCVVPAGLGRWFSRAWLRVQVRLSGCRPTLVPRRHRFAAASGQAALFENSRRRTWPFHIHNPERTMTGRKTYRVWGA